MEGFSGLSNLHFLHYYKVSHPARHAQIFPHTLSHHHQQQQQPRYNSTFVCLFVQCMQNMENVAFGKAGRQSLSLIASECVRVYIILNVCRTDFSTSSIYFHICDEGKLFEHLTIYGTANETK